MDHFCCSAQDLTVEQQKWTTWTLRKCCMPESQLHAKTTFRTQNGGPCLQLQFSQKFTSSKKGCYGNKLVKEKNFLKIILKNFEQTPLLTKMFSFIDKVFLKYYDKISQFLYIVTNCCHKRYVYFPLPPLVQGRGFLRCAQIWLLLRN